MYDIIQIAVVGGIIYFVYSIGKDVFSNIYTTIKTALDKVKENQSIVKVEQVASSENEDVEIILDGSKQAEKIAFKYLDPSMLDIQNQFKKQFLKNINKADEK